MPQSFRLHHVGLLVADIHKARERLIERFAYVVESDVIEDPTQTALVQFLRLPGADHWTELVSPNGPQSKLSSAIKERRGGTHHLCYEVLNIDLACDELREQRMAVVALPAPAVAFAGRRIAWLLDRDYLLTELVEAGLGPLSLPPLR